MSDKSSKEIAVEMAFQGMLPLMAQRLRNSEQYQAIIKSIAEARVTARDVRAQARSRIEEIMTEALNRIDETDQLIEEKLAALETQASDFLTEHGLTSVLADIRAAEPAKPEPSATDSDYPVAQESAD